MDIDVTVNNQPIQVTTTQVVTNVTVAQVGLQGPPGTPGTGGSSGGTATGDFYPSDNPAQFATSGNLQNTGVSLTSTILLLSGDIQNTGIALNDKINTLSGYSYPFSNPNSYTTSGNLQSTGSSLQLQVNNINGLTGSLYPYNNPSNFSNSGNLQSTGQALQSQINSINTLSGSLYSKNNPSGYITGFNSGQYLTGFNSGQYALASNLQNTGINLTSLISTTTGYLNTNPSGFITSSQTGQFYPTSNPQNYSNSGNVQSTGQTLNTKINVLSGYSYPFSNPNNYATSGNLQTTGQNLYNLFSTFSGCNVFSGVYIYNNSTQKFHLLTISGVAGQETLSLDDGVSSVSCNSNLVTVTTANFYSSNNPSGFISGFNSGQYALSTALQTTGQTLLFYLDNASGILSNRLYLTGVSLTSLIAANSVGVSNINVTGFGGQSGMLNFSGLGSVTVLTGLGNFIYFSGSSSPGQSSNSDGINLSGNLQSTGQALTTLISNLSGYYNANPSGFVTSQNLVSYITTGSADERYVNITGNENINNLKTFSGALFTGYFSGINLTGHNINALGSLLYKGHAVPTGSGPQGALTKFNGNGVSASTFSENAGVSIIHGPSGPVGATAYQLSLQDNASSTWLEILNNGGINKGAFFGISNDTTANAFELYNYQGGPIDFFTFPTASNGTNRFRIANEGNVGINSLTPISKLDVSGHILAVNISGNQFYGSLTGSNITGYNLAVLNRLTISGNTVVTGGPYLSASSVTGLPSYYAKFGSNSTGLITGLIYENNGFIGINKTNPSSLLNISGNFIVEALAKDTLISGSGNNTTFAEFNIQNYNTGASASSDVVATMDIGTAGAYYVDLGINSSRYTGTFIGLTGDAYLFSQANDLFIGNAAANKNVHFFAGATPTGANSGIFSISPNRFNINSSAYISGNPILHGTNITGGTGIRLSQSGGYYLINERNPMCVTFSAAAVTWTNMPLALTFFNATAFTRTFIDLSGYNEVNFTANLTTAGTVSGFISLRYADNTGASVTVTNYRNIDTDGTVLKLESAISKSSGWHRLAEGAKSGIHVAVVGLSGSAAVSPIFGVINAYFR